MNTDSADRLLTTTRSVRKRLDFERAVEPELVEDCIRVAMQAPTGSNRQGWHVVVVTDQAKREAIAGYYRKGFEIYAGMQDDLFEPFAADDLRTEQMPRVIDSASYLAANMERAPVFVIFCIEGRVEEAGVIAQASSYGSILPAAWSFMLAARARGLGTAWTTIHLFFEKEISELLAIPAGVTQSVLFPVAYFTGDDFKPAKRLPVEQTSSWETWGGAR